MDKPAILGGTPVFSEKIGITRPSTNNYIKEVEPLCRQILDSGILTAGQYTRKLEEEFGKYANTKYAFTTSSATSAMILLFKNLINKNKDEVILPSFSFLATAHAVVWAGGKPRFVDCDPLTFNIDTKKVEENISSKTACILPVNVFGNLCDISELEKISKEKNVKLFFDSAESIGSKYMGKNIGNFGDAEFFSMSPTKIINSMEGGITTTNNYELANTIRFGRDYGKNQSYECEEIGLSSKITEIGAALCLAMLKDTEKFVQYRNKAADMYKKNLSILPGIKFQKIKENVISSYNYLAILIDKNEFGISRDMLSVSLEKEGIATKKYFSPPVHTLKCYSHLNHDNLTNTNKLSENILCLPISNDISIETIDKITYAIKRIHDFARQINKNK